MPAAAPSTLWLGKADYPLFVVEGTDAKNGSLTIERATLDAPGGPVEGFRFTTLQHGQTPLTMQARALAPQAAEAGDVLLAHFFLRTVKSEQESGEGTIDNALKWPRWEKDHELPLQAARWFKEHDVALRGHNLVRPGWRHLPADVKALQGKPEELHKFVISHVEDEAAALAQYVVLVGRDQRDAGQPRPDGHPERADPHRDFPDGATRVTRSRVIHQRLWHRNRRRAGPGSPGELPQGDPVLAGAESAVAGHRHPGAFRRAIYRADARAEHPRPVREIRRADPDDGIYPDE